MSVRVNCWNCAHEIDVRAGECGDCSSLQPLFQEADHFEIMGLTPRGVIDNSELEKIFHALSRQYHPDKFVAKSPTERRISEQRSAALNTAYRTLRNPLSLAEYLVARSGRKKTEDSSKVPPEFAEALFEIQEKIMDLKMAEGEERDKLVTELTEVKSGLEKERTELTSEVKACLKKWDADRAEENDKVRDELLSEIEKTLARRSYLSTMVRDITNAGVA